MTANQTQVGGDYYKTKYEHWDLAVFADLGYLEGNSTKYVTRWRKKDGLKDLQKALHYLDKLIEVYPIYTPARIQSRASVEAHVLKFTDANGLDTMEHDYILRLCLYETLNELHLARVDLISLIEMTVNHPGTPDDGGHHANYDPK